MTPAASPRAFVWELTLVVLILLAATWASMTSPFYLSFDQITYSLQQSMAVVGLIALGLMAVVVVGEIDISLPAILALGNILFMQLAIAHCPVWLAVPAVLFVCALAGLFNGLLVVAFGLPSLAVTLGAMGAYRALALLLAGQEGFADFPASYIWLGSSSIADVLPASLVLVALVAFVFGFVMHRTVLGRSLFVCGLNSRAALLSGVRVKRVKTAAFAIGGAMAGLASLVYVGQFQSARARQCQRHPALRRDCGGARRRRHLRRARQCRRRSPVFAAARNPQERHGPRECGGLGSDIGDRHAAHRERADRPRRFMDGRHNAPADKYRQQRHDHHGRTTWTIRTSRF